MNMTEKYGSEDPEGKYFLLRILLNEIIKYFIIDNKSDYINGSEITRILRIIGFPSSLRA